MIHELAVFQACLRRPSRAPDRLVPILLGRGERLFDGLDDLRGLSLLRTVAAPAVTHLKFARP